MDKAPPLTIRQMRAINAVATHASLARACEHLNISQSSLSRYIAEAEQGLRQKLFQRGWTGMEPTSQGEAVIAHCRRMVSAIESAQAELRATGARAPDLSHYLTWEMLESANAVRKTGGVSAAAGYLGQSQPNVSRALAKLATAVGRKPFRRARTGMEANRDAALLCDLYGKLLLDVMALPSLLAAMSAEVTGRISVGLLPFSEQAMIMKAFGQMLKRHRHVRLQAVTGSYPALIDGLRQNELDFVIGPLRNPPPYDTLEETSLYRESFAMVVRKGHRLARGRPALADLLNENWIVAPHGTPTRRYFEDLLIGQGLTPPAQTCEIVTFSLAEQMVLDSDAVAVLTYSAEKRKALRDGLRILPIDLPNSEREIGLTFRRHQPLTVAQKAFVEILTQGRGWPPGKPAH